MSNQQSMFSPEESSHAQQERPYNDDPRERGSQQQFQGQPMGESGYEAGYQGYSGAYGQGEKLRPKPPSPQSGQIILFIVVILLIGGASGTLGSLFSALFGFLGGGLGLIIAAVIVVAAVSTRPVRLPTRTFAISEHAALSIHNDAGNVRILRGESSQVEVRATRYVSRLFGDMGVGEEPIYYSQEGDSISVNVRHWNFMRFLNVGYVSLEVLVPAS
ncbi:MAG: hypothetical protein J2P37_26380, partial [Ktedonobacteraceae bacterium]|nr:hypothetical protein [Ktedonobacteraceae bacterium]